MSHPSSVVLCFLMFWKTKIWLHRIAASHLPDRTTARCSTLETLSGRKLAMRPITLDFQAAVAATSAAIGRAFNLPRRLYKIPHASPWPTLSSGSTCPSGAAELRGTNSVEGQHPVHLRRHRRPRSSALRSGLLVKGHACLSRTFAGVRLGVSDRERPCIASLCWDTEAELAEDATPAALIPATAPALLRGPGR